MGAEVRAVARSGEHRLSRWAEAETTPLAGLGVEGDAHLGVTVQHPSRVKADPTQPDPRRMHIIHAELFGELAGKGSAVAPAGLGGNVTTRGIDLPALPPGTRLRLGPGAVVELTGPRDPCARIERHRPGSPAAVPDRAPEDELVLAGGTARPGDAAGIEPPPPHERLERV